MSEHDLKNIMNILSAISNPNAVFTKSQAAEYLGVSISSLEKYTQVGLLPRGHKLDKCQKTLYWDKFDLDKFLTEKEYGTSKV